MSGVEIQVQESRLQGLARSLDGVYTKLSGIKTELENLHAGIKASWSDPAVEEFNGKFEEGMDRVWDLLVAVDGIEAFFSEAAEAYMAADREVASL